MGVGKVSLFCLILGSGPPDIYNQISVHILEKFKVGPDMAVYVAFLNRFFSDGDHRAWKMNRRMVLCFLTCP